MLGTILNVSGILAGGIAGLARRKPLAPATEAYARIVLAAFTAFYGLRLMWLSISGSWPQIFKQLLIVVVALMLGRLTGRLLRFQKLSNHLGRQARERLAAVRLSASRPPGEGFKTCAALFCAAPLGILGAIQEGLTTPPYFYPLAVKAVIDGLATMGFVSVFGWGVLLAVVPVLAFQGTLTFVGERFVGPLLSAPMVDSANAVGGLLVSAVALVMLGLKRIEMADYLPSLVFAPLLTRLFP
jgi:uncharacterized membrane protein YqgA involved in biofilm formation